MTATAADLRITVQGVRFVAARQDGRYRVIDQEQDFAVVGTCATRAKAEERAAAMNAAEAVSAPLEVVTLDGEETTLEVTPTAAEKDDAAAVLAEAVASGRVSFDAAASALLSGVSLETAAAIAAPQEDPADAIAAAAAEILAVASANAAKPAKKGKAAAAETPAAGHRISWFVYLEDGVRTRYSTTMTGDLPAWDLTCSCGWDSRTGGATKGAVRKAMAAHKAEAASA